MTEKKEVSSQARVVIGKVVSDKMEKTIVVEIERLVKHRLYGKYTRKTTKLKAHDEKNAAKQGDTVKIHESRPLSKQKTWILQEVIS